MGMIRLRGNKYWIKYYRNGKAFEESVDKVLGKRHASYTDAKRLLKQREGAIANGIFRGLAAEKTEFGGFREVTAEAPYDYRRFETVKGKRKPARVYAAYGMVKELVDDYRINRRKSIDRALRSCWELSRKFEGIRLAMITTDLIREYTIDRQREKMANASINRELAALARIFSLAHDATPPKIVMVPKIEMLEERNVRRGFFEHAEFLAVRNELPEYLRPVADIGYTYGARKVEILSIEWTMVDMINGKISLGESKNGDPRIWYLTPELYQTLLAYKMRRDRDFPDEKRVFVHPDGSPVRHFRKGWEAACRRAGLEGRLFHDLRRTAVRNMELAGVSRKVAMLISGHKTESVYNRYRIVAENDLAAAAASVAGYYRSMGVKVEEYSKTVTNTVTIEEEKEGEAQKQKT